MIYHHLIERHCIVLMYLHLHYLNNCTISNIIKYIYC